jgi:hypothetical protein
MRIALDKLMEKLAVDRVLSPYETQPWFFYDEAQGITCSAEVRMGPGGDDLEAEIQFLHDNPPEPPPPPPPPEIPKYGLEYDQDPASLVPPPAPYSTGGIVPGGGPVQIMLLRAGPIGPEKEWGAVDLKVKGESFANKIYNWEEKGCDFFRACIQSMLMDELPKVDDLIEQELSDDESSGGGRRGRVGRKAPKIKPGQLLGMKKGM